MYLKDDNFNQDKEPKSIEQIMSENNLNQINSIMGFLFSPTVLTPAPYSTSTSNIPTNEKDTSQDRLN
jgi:hypothetical protein